MNGIGDNFLNAYGREVRVKDSSKEIHLIRNFVCYFQNHLLQYTFTLNQKQINLRESLHSKKIRSNLEEINRISSDYETYFYNTLKQVSEHSFTILLKYFLGRSTLKPRLAIKILRGEDVISLFRNTHHHYPNSIENVQENTALQEILNLEKKYYLCNDIPARLKEGNYINRRINYDLALDYRSPTLADQIFRFRFQNKYDKKWIQCWEDKGGLDLSSCYKSTLVIPMSFTSNDLKTDLKSHLNIQEEKRMICGFLCIDHVETYFFKEQIDVATTYIIADILSIYFMYQLIYTQYSPDFYDLKSLISQGE